MVQILTQSGYCMVQILTVFAYWHGPNMISDITWAFLPTYLIPDVFIQTHLAGHLRGNWSHIYDESNHSCIIQTMGPIMHYNCALIGWVKQPCKTNFKYKISALVIDSTLTTRLVITSFICITLLATARKPVPLSQNSTQIAWCDIYRAWAKCVTKRGQVQAAVLVCSAPCGYRQSLLMNVLVGNVLKMQL